MRDAAETALVLDERKVLRARKAMHAVSEGLALEKQLEPYGALRWRPMQPDAPSLHLDDVSGIPFLVNIAGVEEYQHRARLRARSGDLFAAVTPSAPGYEDYCRKQLGLGAPEFVLATPIEGPLAVAVSCGAGRALSTIVEHASQAGGLIVHPYMGIEAVWQLADRIADLARVPVVVAAPPPPVMWIANDKGLFSDVVTRVLGKEWLVDTRTSHDATEMTKHLLDLAQQNNRVALKRLRCASAMGNVVYRSDDLVAAGAESVEKGVRAFLEKTEWDGKEDVQAVAWVETEESPSTQLWIPAAGDGAPRLEGIYDQLLEGDEKVFLGSRPSALPAPVLRAAGHASLEIAVALQFLGYVGRCSFDLILTGDPEGQFELMFTECNGRWGGTSTPMSLVDRLTDGKRPPYFAQDYMHEKLVGVPFPDILESVGDQLYDPKTKLGRFIFYNVGPLEKKGKLDVIAIGDTVAAAESAMRDDFGKLLRL